MDHSDHIALIEEGVPDSCGVWADFGSGSGAFTLALAEILASGSQIFSVDKDAASLQRQQRTLQARYPRFQVQYLNADYTLPLELPPLTGVLMANALHFQRTKEPVLAQIKKYLVPSGRLILVEYNQDQGNVWVPYPLSFRTWQGLAQNIGFATTRLLTRHPSRFMGEIYSALSCLPSLNEPVNEENK